MKKVLLSLMLLFTTSIIFAQVTTYCYKAEILKWTTYTKHWELFDTQYPDGLNVIFNNSRINVTDQANSSYRIFLDMDTKYDVTYSGDPYTAHSWKCYDEKNRTVIVSLINYETSKTYVFTVMYDDRLFKYYINQK